MFLWRNMKPGAMAGLLYRLAESTKPGSGPRVAAKAPPQPPPKPPKPPKSAY